MSGNDISLCCEKCGSELGVFDDTVSGWKIYKWGIRLRKDRQSELRVFSAQKWISSLLLSSSENTGVRRFVVENSSPDSNPNTSSPPSILVSSLVLLSILFLWLTHTALAFHARPLLLFFIPIARPIPTTKRPHPRH